MWMPPGSRHSRRRRSDAGGCQCRIVGRMGRVLREGVQDVGEHQFLMLLLVMQADLDDRHDLVERRRVGALDQPLHRRIDMGAIGGDLRDVRPRDQAALRPRVARAGRDVIGVEQKGEALVELAIAGHVRLQQELSRRTRWCARDAIWSGSRPASTARPGLPATAARRGARSPRAPCGRLSDQVRRTLAPGVAESAQAPSAAACGITHLRGMGNSLRNSPTLQSKSGPDCSHGRRSGATRPAAAGGN